MIKQTVLHAIQAGEEEAYYRAVTDAALYFAVAGQLAEATALLRALWQLGLPHSPHVWLQDRAFWVLWHAAGTSVPEAPFAPQPIDEIEREHRLYLGGDRYAYPMPNVEWPELRGKNAFRQAQTWFATTERETETLILLRKALQQPEELRGYEYSDALTLAIELAARSGNEATALALLDRWIGNVLDSNWAWAFGKLAAGRHTAPLLLRGVLRAQLALTPDAARRDLAELTTALHTRTAHGPQPPYAALSWPQLLLRLSQLALADEPDRLTQAEWSTDWLGRPGATAGQIAAKEQQLSLTLPADYKAFLRASDGLAGSGVDPELLPVAEIGLYKDMEDPELYGITATYPDTASAAEEATLAPYLERALLVSRLPAEQELWLIPPAEPTGEWQTWFFAAWVPGEERYASFRHYVEQQVEALEQRNEFYWNR